MTLIVGAERRQRLDVPFHLIENEHTCIFTRKAVVGGLGDLKLLR